MPEYYEVKRIKDYLIDGGIIGQKIMSFTFLNKGERMFRMNTNIPINSIKNSIIEDIQTKAKYTFIKLSTGTLVWHYRFTGIPHLQDKSYQNKLYTLFSLPLTKVKKEHIRLEIMLEKTKLVYVDTRCLSSMYFHPNTEIKHTLQYTNIADDLDTFKIKPYSNVCNEIKNRRLILKDWLQRQDIEPSGIGNYLACEICAHAMLDPFLKVQELTEQQYKNLVKGIIVVKENCRRFNDYKWFRVFNLDHCVRCKTKIKKEKYKKNAQTTHYCPKCQRSKIIS